MTNVKLIIGGVVLLALGFVLGVYGTHQTATFGALSYDVNHFVGDIYNGTSDTLIATGGKLVGNVSSTSVNAGSVTDLGSITVGGSAAANKFTIVGIGTTTVNNTALGTYVQTTSTATTSIPIGVAGFSVGDACFVGLTTAPTATAFGLDANLATTSATAATATVTFWNGASSAVTVTTGTLRVACFHAGI